MDPESSLFILRLTYHKTFKMSQQEAKRVHFLPSCIGYLILVYLVLVLPFVKILEQKIQKLAGQNSSPLLFNIEKRAMGTSDLTVTMSKYSQEFLGQRMIPSIYRYIIIGIIQLCTNPEINSKTGGLILSNTTNISFVLGAVQAHHSQHMRNMKYAHSFNILPNMNGNLQDLIFQYCEIYHITMGFHDIHLPLLGTPQTLTFSSLSERKRGAESFSLFVIWLKQIYIKPGKGRQIFQEVGSKRKNETFQIKDVNNPDDPFV